MTGESRDYKIGICYFSAFKSKSEDCLAQNQENDMSTHGVVSVNWHYNN